eukprot:5249389-Pyramimonas_sp.AAC.1
MGRGGPDVAGLFALIRERADAGPIEAPRLGKATMAMRMWPPTWFKWIVLPAACLIDLTVLHCGLACTPCENWQRAAVCQSCCALDAPKLPVLASWLREQIGYPIEVRSSLHVNQRSGSRVLATQLAKSFGLVEGGSTE